MATTTSADLDARLAELIARFEASSDAKGGRARIRYHAPSEAWGPPEDWDRNPRRRWFNGTCPPPIVKRVFPQAWSIVYLEKNSDQVSQFGMTIGRTKAGAIRWLLDHDRKWNRAK